MTSPSTTRLRAAALACLGALILAGCAEDRLGTALIIDGRSLSTQELQDAAREYIALVPAANPGDVQLSILQRRIVSAVIDEVASKHDVRVSAGRVAEERDDLLDSIGGRKSLIRTLGRSQQATVVAPSYLDRFIKDRLLFDRIASDICNCDVRGDSAEAQQAYATLNDELRDTSAAMDIEISPRYGEWDPDQGVIAQISGGLSKTVDELRGSGS